MQGRRYSLPGIFTIIYARNGQRLRSLGTLLAGAKEEADRSFKDLVWNYPADESSPSRNSLLLVIRLDRVTPHSVIHDQE